MAETLGYAELRKGNTFFVVVRDESAGSYLWQIQEGARKRTPVASGLVSEATAREMIASHKALGWAVV